MNVTHFLQDLPKETVYYQANPGNGGDAIIAFGAYQLFKKTNTSYRIIKSSDHLEGKILLYAGGGNLIDKYTDCATFIRENERTAKLIVLLPHTVSGHADLLGSLSDNVHVFCREHTSFNYLKNFHNLKNVSIDDDLALTINVAEVFPTLKPAKNLLRLIPPSRLKDAKERRMVFNHLLHRNAHEFNCFREDVEKTAINIPKDNLDLPEILNFDTRMTNEKNVEKTVQNILRYLASFRLINTNRLHICIAGALLGKEVNFYSNSYWKNQSVYEMSIKDRFPNVKWLN